MWNTHAQQAIYIPECSTGVTAASSFPKLLVALLQSCFRFLCVSKCQEFIYGGRRYYYYWERIKAGTYTPVGLYIILASHGSGAHTLFTITFMVGDKSTSGTCSALVLNVDFQPVSKLCFYIQPSTYDIFHAVFILACPTALRWVCACRTED